MKFTEKDKTGEYEELSNKQMESIQNEQKQFQIIGHAEPVGVLVAEFQNSPNFLKKVFYLQNVLNKRMIRRIRKDGSCFYRGFLFGLARNFLRGTLDYKEGKYSLDKVGRSFR
ncbi:MAG: hypothetical protein AAF847_14175 [Bacteroidota bacterium]